MLALLQQSTAVLSNQMTRPMAMHSCVCTQLKLNLSLLLSQAAVAEDEIHEWCAGDFSQGLLPSTGAPGIVVPMVRICTSSSLWASFVSCLCTTCTPSNVICRCVSPRNLRISCVGMFHHLMLEAPSMVHSAAQRSTAQHTVTTLTSQDHQAC